MTGAVPATDTGATRHGRIRIGISAAILNLG
jgi:hypothetical protein